MQKIILGSFAAALLLTGCNSASDKVNSNFEKAYSSVKEEYAPDGRTKVFNYKLENENGAYVLRGSTNDAAAKAALIDKLDKDKIFFVDSTVLLPAVELGDKTYGVATQSVINFRTSGRYAAEAATQVMMGTPLEILEKKGGWTRAISPEGYISWVTSGSLQEFNKKEMEDYLRAPKVIVTTKYATITSAPKSNSGMVSDVVWGNILIDLGKKDGMQKVSLADGREEYLPSSDVESFDKWLKQRDLTAENIISTAREFIGVPYMWGGTSMKAVDCSGFTKTVYFLNGVILARDASQQCYTGDDVDIKDYTDNKNYTVDALGNLKKGDLIFFGTKATPEKKERITHVGIYIDNGKFIHSATRVKENSLVPTDSDYYDGSKRMIRAQRIIGTQDKGKGVESIDKSNYLPS